MTSRSLRKFKHLSYLILFFFCWTNLGIYNIAYAAANGSGQGPVAGGQLKAKSAEEKFQESLERLRDAVGKEDSAKIKAERAELEKQDLEIKKQFKETEEKIKGLPEAVKQRHREFVRKYEENLNTLKGHLDGIEKAKTKSEVKVELDKAKAFLEKTKPPKRHVSLDPNKLPHRTVEPKFKEPRLKKEEFEPQRAQRAQRKPIIVAANGPLTGLLSSDSEFSTGVMPYAPTNIQLAANTVDLPTASDLSETIEVQFTPDIRAKAQALGNNPVKIYEWVRNNIEYVPTYGSIQGSDMCLQTKQCNDFDTASLLIALLRASNISARYVYGTIELPIEKVMNWVGGFTNEQAAVNFIASGGVPIKAYASGGKIAKVQMEHVWVETYIPYGNYRGSMRDQSGKTWIPMDGSYKQYIYTQPTDIKTVMGFDPQAFINQLQSTATLDTTTGAITNMDSVYIKNQLTQAQNTFQEYLNANMPEAAVKEVFGGRIIVQENLGLLPAVLPYKKIATLQKYSEVSDSMRHKVIFAISDEWGYSEVINITKTIPELAARKITLSYAPATSEDEAVLLSYSNAEATQYSAYLINLKPELKIEGVTIAVGGTINMGKGQIFTMSFITPGYGTETVTNPITAGTFYAIGFDVGTISQNMMIDRKTKLEETKAILDSGSVVGVTKEAVVGDILYLTALNYFTQLDAYDMVNKPSMGIVSNRLPSEGITAFELKLDYLWGIPSRARFGGLSIDVDRNILVVNAKDGNKDKAKQFVVLSGMRSSAMEHSIFEQMYGSQTDPVYGVSAVKILSMANNIGILIYTVDQNNLNQILPLLQISQEVKDEIQNAVNAGKVVTIPKTEINYHGWQGVGYIVMDPDTGSAAYMISGGLAGGWVILGLLSLLLLKWGIAMMLLYTGPALLFAPALIGAVLAGLGIGLVASQLLTDDVRVRTLINQILQTIIWGALSGEIGLAIATSMIPALWGILFLALVISLFLPYNDLGVFLGKRRQGKSALV